MPCLRARGVFIPFDALRMPSTLLRTNGRGRDGEAEPANSRAEYTGGMQTWSARDGVWQRGEAEGADFAWFDITGREDPALDELATRFQLHPLAVEDCRSELAHAPKIDDFGEHLFIVLHGVMDGNRARDRETEEFDVFLGSNFLITYQDRAIEVPGADGDQPVAAVLISALENGIAVRPGPDGALYELLDRVVDAILPRVNALTEQLDAIHDEILASGHDRVQHRDILALRARAGHIRRVLTPELAVVQRLSRGGFAEISEENRIYFRDIYDHLVRADLALQGLREDTEVAISTYLSAINNRLSEVMKVLAVVSALLLPGTVITGVFGTNFDNVPGLHSNWGFAIMMGGMASIAAGMGLYFKRKGWF